MCVRVLCVRVLRVCVCVCVCVCTVCVYVDMSDFRYVRPKGLFEGGQVPKLMSAGQALALAAASESGHARPHRGTHCVGGVDDTNAGKSEVCELDLPAVVDEHVVRLQRGRRGARQP